MAVQTKLQHRRDTAANWTTTNPTLASGEIGFETDTLKFKVGNGSTAWTSLKYSQDASLLNGTASITALTTTGDVSAGGVLKSTASSGDEGGQIDLTKSVTNTTLTTGVSIDVYQNKLRFFETGGTNRGYYIDISGGGASVGTNLASSSFTGGTLTSNLTVAAGTTSLSPLTFQSGTNLTTVTSGAREFDGTVFYSTSSATPGRALDTQNYYYIHNSPYGLDFSAAATAQSILGGTTTGITLAAGTTYEFELYAALQHQYVTNTTMALSHGWTSTTVTGSPTVAYVQYLDYSNNTTGFTTAATKSSVRTTTTTVTVSAAVTTGSRYSIYIGKGTIRVTGTGTVKVYPHLVSSGTGDNGVTIQAGTYLKLTPIGNGTVTTVGTWA